MLNGLNSLRLSLMSLNTRRVKKMLLLMLSRRYTMLSQLDFKIFGLETIKDQYVHDAEFKDVCRIVKKGEHGTSSSLMLNLCFVLTSYAFQLALFIFCCCRRHMEGD